MECRAPALRQARYKNFGRTTCPVKGILRNHEKIRFPKFQVHRLTATFARANLKIRLFGKISVFGLFLAASSLKGMANHFSGHLSLYWELVGQTVVLSVHSSASWLVSWSVSASICPSVWLWQIFITLVIANFQILRHMLTLAYHNA